MNHPVLSALLPVVLLIAAGVLAGRAGWVRAQGSKELSNLVLMVLMPALMFRTMSRVQAGAFDLRPVAMYLLAALLLFALMLAWQGLNRRGILLALTAIFSNTVAVGISLVGLAYGQDGLVILFALISVHALVLLTLATLLLELAAARGFWSRRALAKRCAPPCSRCEMAFSIRCLCPSSVACCLPRPAGQCPRCWTGCCNC